MKNKCATSQLFPSICPFKWIPGIFSHSPQFQNFKILHDKRRKYLNLSPVLISLRFNKFWVLEHMEVCFWHKWKCNCLQAFGLPAGCLSSWQDCCLVLFGFLTWLSDSRILSVWSRTMVSSISTHHSLGFSPALGKPHSCIGSCFSWD